MLKLLFILCEEKFHLFVLVLLFMRDRFMLDVNGMLVNCWIAFLQNGLYCIHMEAELFIKPGIKNFKELNPGEQGFSRAQSSAYISLTKRWNQDVEHFNWFWRLLLKITFEDHAVIKIMQLQSLRGGCSCLPSYQLLK